MSQSPTSVREAPAVEVALKHREEEFHDSWADSIEPASVLVDESWLAVTCPENRWIREQLGDLRGKRVLDLGCGAGEAAVWFAKQGAIVVASDLSSSFLRLVERVAALHAVNVQTHHGDADALGIPGGEKFDVIYAANLLHHVDTARTLDQIEAALAPGGVVVSWDPLRHNPIINVYRRLASSVRTPDEHPLDIRDLELFRARFTDVRYQCFWLATLWIFVRFFVIERVHPGRERYWKKIIQEHQRLTSRYRRLERVDRALLRRMPWLKRYCWNIAVYAKKRA